MRPTRVLSLSLPPDLVRAAERLAKQESRTARALPGGPPPLHRGTPLVWAPARRQSSARLGMTESDVERAVRQCRRGRGREEDREREGDRD